MWSVARRGSHQFSRFAPVRRQHSHPQPQPPQQPASRLPIKTITATTVISLTAATAYHLERSPRSFPSAPTTLAVASVRFSRAFISSARIYTDYRVLFARHAATGYDTEAYLSERSATHVVAAERLLGLCRTQGGVYVKAGQHVASANRGVPAEYTSRLVELEDHAAYRGYGVIERVLKAELGREIGEVFEEFGEVPVAAASLAQVHRGKLKSGEVVACKVQYPGLPEMIAGDLATIRFLSKLMVYFLNYVSLDWMVDQFRDNLKKEMDFGAEAKQSEETRLFFEGHETVSVPKIYEEFSTSKVLCMDYVADACRVDDLEQLDTFGINRDELAEALIDCWGRQTFISGHVHCDGHGGNVLISPRRNAAGDPTGKFDLHLLDHGLYRDLSQGVRKAYCLLWRGLILRRSADVNRACAEMGLGPEYGNLFSIFLLNRGLNSTSLGQDIRTKLSREDMRELVSEMRVAGIESGADMSTLLQGFPSDLLLIFKANALVRNLNKALGAKVNRFSSNVRIAVRGLHYSPPSEASVERSILTRTLDSISFISDVLFVELNLVLIDFALFIVRWFKGVSEPSSDLLLG